MSRQLDPIENQLVELNVAHPAILTDHRKRADAVLEGQKLWRTASTQCVLFTEVLDKALLKMERVKNQKGTIKSFFQVVPKAATVDQDLHDNGQPEKEPVLVTVQVPEETLAQLKVVSGNLGLQLKSCQQKLTKMLEMLPVLFNAKTALETAIDSLQASVRAQNARRFNRLTGNSEYKLLAGNSLGLSWEKAVEKITEMESNGDKSLFDPLNAMQLYSFPSLKDMCHRSDMLGIPGHVLAEHFKLTDDNLKNAVDELLDMFPLLCVARGGHYVLLDYVELVFRPNLVYEVLTLDSVDKTEDLPSTQQSDNGSEDGIFFYQKSGQTPLQEKYPQLLDVMMNFVQLHGFGAHIRRRTGTATSCGVTLDDVRKHLLENVEGLDTISRTKVYYLMKPARVNSREAARHKDALDIRVGTKSCDVSKDNPNAHEYFATVSNVRQMCAMYPDECVAFSCDSKAKIHIGGQAVSRYHQLRTFFPGDDTPHYADHDFPVPGYLIEPDGYLQLQMKEAEAPSTKDKCGRDVVEVPSTGPLWVFNRTVKNTSTTIEDHMNDLKVIMKDNPSLDKPILVLVTDGGPDWTPKTNLNEFFLGKLWKEGKYDMLISTCMPAGLSRYNPIEHLWSPLSKFLAGVSLPACLPGETVPPALQSISPDEKLEKETIVFENALNRLNMYWDGRVHDGFRITSKAVLPNAGDENGTYTVVRNMFHSSLRGIRESSDLSEAHDEWKYISAHMDRRSGFVCFRKGSCGESTCKCMEDGVRASKVWKMPSGDKWLFPPITPDPEHPGHYKTLRQLERSLAFSSPDQHLKNFEARSCTHCRYIFTSKADEEKHTKLIHGGVRALRDANQDKASHRCPVCDQKYPTRYRLLKHQDEEGHKLKKGRPSKN
ncbi:uncharacterized protein [Diadema antillarum]|uniref:uncharacterized protein n=1 Tax=Diadema antillarum TaxID=105358 RepID=UPI003A8697F7